MVPINLVKRMTDHKIYKLPKHKIPFSERFPIIAIEGIDGAGKTTTASALAKMIKGHYIITPPDDYKRLRPFFELPERSGKARLLFYAGSLWDVWEDIRERCKVQPVVLDRYTVSTIFYHETLLEEDLSYIYDNIFRPHKYEKLNLLEIGVGGYDDPYSGGESVFLWKSYFPFARLFFVDYS